MTELRLARRRLMSQPGVSLAAMLALACAMAASAITWTVVSAVLLRPLPVADPDRLVAIAERAGRDAGTRPPNEEHLYTRYVQIRDADIFAGITAMGLGQELVAGGTGTNSGVPADSSTGRASGGTATTASGAATAGSGAGATRGAAATPAAATSSAIAAPAPTPVPIVFASHDYFDVLGVPLHLGRSFTRDDDRRGAPAVAVVSHRYWVRELGARADALGRQITVAGTPATVVGVAARAFRGTNLAVVPDLYLPLHIVADLPGADGQNYFAEAGHQSSPTAWLQLIARLRPDSSAAQATLRLDAMPPPPRHDRMQAELIDLNRAAVPGPARLGLLRFARLLGTTVGLLLVAGCVTVGTLLLVRAEARRSEFALCLALGGSRGRLVRGMTIEAILLAAGASLLALPIAGWLIGLLRSVQLPGGIAIDPLALAVDLRVLAATTLCGLVASLLMALVAAAALAFPGDLSAALRSGTSGASRTPRRRMQSALIVGQIAVALVLVVGAGLLLRSMANALTLNPGIDTNRIVTASFSTAPQRYTPARAQAFVDDLLGRLGSNPAIRAAALTSNDGGGMSGGYPLTIDGVARTVPSFVAFVGIDDRYLETMGMRVLQGRGLTEEDTARAPLVGLVSESFARFIARGSDPIGHRITMFSRPAGEASFPVLRVVGVVPDVITNVRRLEPMVLYQPLAQQPVGGSATVVVRAAADVEAAKRELLAAGRSIDPAVMPSPPMTIDERLGRQMGAQRFAAIVLGGLGTVATLLMLLGVYVIAESMAALRLREFGVRGVLGATRAQLSGLVLLETGRLVVIGLALGLGLAWLGSTTIRAFLFRIEPWDPATLGIVSLTTLLLSLAVSARAARRAATVDLAAILRRE